MVNVISLLFFTRNTKYPHNLHKKTGNYALAGVDFCWSIYTLRSIKEISSNYAVTISLTCVERISDVGVC